MHKLDMYLNELAVKLPVNKTVILNRFKDEFKKLANMEKSLDDAYHKGEFDFTEYMNRFNKIKDRLDNLKKVYKNV